MSGSDLAGVFRELRGRSGLAFIPYQTAGFPTLSGSLDHLERLAELGADVLELGIPFSDPMADGPTVQHSSRVALQQGVNLAGIVSALKQRRIGKPIVMMSYLNVLLAYGRERLLPDLRAAGVQGLIIPDLPHDEADDWLGAARAHGLALIFLVAPTSTDDSIRAAAERSDAFLYAVSLTGTTGAREHLPAGLPAFLKRIRSLTERPVVVGFGISRPEHVRELRGQADGVIVASRLLDAIQRNENWLEIAAGLQAATRS